MESRYPHFQVELSLYQVRKTWEHYHKRLFPMHLAYADALKEMWHDHGFAMLNVAHQWEEAFDDALKADPKFAGWEHIEKTNFTNTGKREIKTYLETPYQENDFTCYPIMQVDSSHHIDERQLKRAGTFSINNNIFPRDVIEAIANKFNLEIREGKDE